MAVSSAPMIFNGLTLIIIAVSVVMLFRQKGSYFKPVRLFLISAYLLFSITLILEFLRDIFETDIVAFYYTQIGLSAVILANLALTVSAATLAQQPSIVLSHFGFKSKRSLNWALLSYALFAAFLLASLWVTEPFTMSIAVRPYGDEVLTPMFHDWYSLGLVVLLFAFVAYPSRMMILRSRMIRSPIASRALMILPVSWSGVGGVLIVFNGYLRLLGIEAVDIGNLISAGLFSVTTYFFRRITLLESFFEEPAVVLPVKPEQEGLFSSRLGVSGSQILGKKMLLEFDPSSSFERIVKDFVYESLSASLLALVLTRRGSPVHLALEDQPQVRFLCLTPSVSYPQQGASERELLLPSEDLSIVLGAMDKALSAEPDAKITIVVDSLSGIIISSGFEKTYSFLVYSLELLSNPRVTALYLLNPSANDPKNVSTIRALFATQIAQRDGGFRVVKAIQS
ncbi:MAG: hypothetical protein HYU39_06640 [Thaumarchaeota archaeon]|nr:hypothetical protein [Nitrososphaerota archaeon]